MSATNTSLLYGDSPLAAAWLAASLERKLSKQQYLKTSIINSTKAIEQSNDYADNKDITLQSGDSHSQLRFPTQVETSSSSSNAVKREGQDGSMPLRISGQLLYGVVKIYSRKTRYLYEEVSLALIQLKSAFAISKSLTLPVEETVLSSLDNVVLKDTITEVNVMYDIDNFDLDRVFGSSSGSSRNTQVWTNSDTFGDDYDYAMGDISMGRNANAGEDNDGSVTVNFENDFEEANQSIDALARRAERPADDLDNVAEFELPLDLNLKGNNDDPDIAGITDFQISGIDNMDLEFTIDDVNDENVENEERSMEEDVNEDESTVAEKSTRRKRRVKRSNFQLGSSDVVRTQRKKVIVDLANEIPSSELKKRQQEYPGGLRDQGMEVVKSEVERPYEIIMGSLNPELLRRIGTTWKTIKRRRLLEDVPVCEREEEKEVEGEEGDALVDFARMENHFEHFGGDEPPVLEMDIPEPAEEEREEQEEEVEEGVAEAEGAEQEGEEADDFDRYETLKAKNKTTIEVAQQLREVFTSEGEHGERITFSEVVDKCNLSENKKSSATRAFFELLVLGTANTVSLKQDRLFGEIIIEGKNDLYDKFIM